MLRLAIFVAFLAVPVAANAQCANGSCSVRSRSAVVVRSAPLLGIARTREVHRDSSVASNCVGGYCSARTVTVRRQRVGILNRRPFLRLVLRRW